MNKVLNKEMNMGFKSVTELSLTASIDVDCWQTSMKNYYYVVRNTECSRNTSKLTPFINQAMNQCIYQMFQKKSYRIRNKHHLLFIPFRLSHSLLWYVMMFWIPWFCIYFKLWGRIRQWNPLISLILYFAVMGRKVAGRMGLHVM